MSEVIPFERKALSAELQGAFADEMGDDLIAGAGGGYGVVSIRGSKWRQKIGGEEKPILNEDGEPKPSITVVMLKASAAVSKQYFAKDYAEGDDSSPDCLSIDGIKPDASSRQPQSDSCASCPHAQWGSKISPSGKKIKACQDSRRVAVTPAVASLDDSITLDQMVNMIENESYGGAMLLRVPAASLSDLKQFGQLLKGKGFPYNNVVARLGFDHNASYPKLTFKAVRALTVEELAVVARMKSGDEVNHILYDAFEGDVDAPSKPVAKHSAVDVEFEDDTPAPAPVPKADKPKKAAAPKAAKPAPAPAPAPAAPAGDDLDGDIDSIISDLEDLG